MPGLVFRGLPQVGPAKWRLLRTQLSKVIGVPPGHITFDEDPTECRRIDEDGVGTPAPIQVFVYWFKGRTPEKKHRVAETISAWLTSDGRTPPNEISFYDQDKTDFYINGEPLT